MFSGWNEMSWIPSTVLAIIHILHFGCTVWLSSRICESADFRSCTILLESTSRSIVLRVLNDDWSVDVVEDDEDKDDPLVMVCWLNELRESCRCDVNHTELSGEPRIYVHLTRWMEVLDHVWL